MIQCNELDFSLSQMSTKIIFHDTVVFFGDTQFGKHCIIVKVRDFSGLTVVQSCTQLDCLTQFFLVGKPL
jgi:hypothetical protein